MSGVSTRVENAVSRTGGTNMPSTNVETSIVADTKADKDANAHIDFMSQLAS